MICELYYSLLILWKSVKCLQIPEGSAVPVFLVVNYHWWYFHDVLLVIYLMEICKMFRSTWRKCNPRVSCRELSLKMSFYSLFISWKFVKCLEIPEGSAVSVFLAVNNILRRSTLYAITALSFLTINRFERKSCIVPISIHLSLAPYPEKKPCVDVVPLGRQPRTSPYFPSKKGSPVGSLLACLLSLAPSV